MVDVKYKLRRAKDFIKETDEITSANKEYIISFADRLSAEGLGIPRQIKYCYNLKTIAMLLGKDFNKATKKDIEVLCSKINNSDYTEWTKHDCLVDIKRSYKWLKDTDEYPQ